MQRCNKLLCQISSSVSFRAAPFKHYLHPHTGGVERMPTETTTHNACIEEYGSGKVCEDVMEWWVVYADESQISIEQKETKDAGKKKRAVEKWS